MLRLVFWHMQSSEHASVAFQILPLTEGVKNLFMGFLYTSRRHNYNSIIGENHSKLYKECFRFIHLFFYKWMRNFQVDLNQTFRACTHIQISYNWRAAKF